MRNKKKYERYIESKNEEDKNVNTYALNDDVERLWGKK